MKKVNELKKILQDQKATLKDEYGVIEMGLFGSYIKGNQTKASDVDILVEFDGPATFDGYMDTLFYLEDLLNCQVDLVTTQGLRARIRPYVEKDLIYVT